MLKISVLLVVAISIACMTMGCSEKREGEVSLPKYFKLQPGQNRMVVACPPQQVLVRVYQEGFAQGRNTAPITVSGFLQSGGKRYSLRSDGNPRAPVGGSFVYHAWILVPEGGDIEINLNVEQGDEVVLAITRPYP